MPTRSQNIYSAISVSKPVSTVKLETLRFDVSGGYSLDESRAMGLPGGSLGIIAKGTQEMTAGMGRL